MNLNFLGKMVLLSFVCYGLEATRRSATSKSHRIYRRQIRSRVPGQAIYSRLASEGVELTESPSHAGSYPPDGFWNRVGWGLRNFAEHSPTTVKSYDYDVTLLQREMLSTFVTFEPFTKRPRVLDVDDAIWVHRGGVSRAGLPVPGTM